MGSLCACQSPVDQAGGRDNDEHADRNMWAAFRHERKAGLCGFAYSALTAGRPATKSEGWIYLHFESGGSKVTRFNLSWLLKGAKTGDGELPKWLSRFVD